MKPTAFKYQVKGQFSSYGVALESRLTAIEAQEYPKVVKRTPLYEIDFTKYKLVPLEPNDEMINIGFNHEAGSEEENDFIRWTNAYMKMIEAAPKIEDL